MQKNQAHNCIILRDSEQRILGITIDFNLQKSGQKPSIIGRASVGVFETASDHPDLEALAGQILSLDTEKQLSGHDQTRQAKVLITHHGGTFRPELDTNAFTCPT